MQNAAKGVTFLYQYYWKYELKTGINTGIDFWGQIQRKTWYMVPYAGVDYNLTLCRLQHMYLGQNYAKVGHKPMPELTLSTNQRFGLCPLPDYKYTVTRKMHPWGGGVKLKLRGKTGEKEHWKPEA